jgi:hypothetical protein
MQRAMPFLSYLAYRLDLANNGRKAKLALKFRSSKWPRGKRLQALVPCQVTLNSAVNNSRL